MRIIWNQKCKKYEIRNAKSVKMIKNQKHKKCENDLKLKKKKKV